MKNELKIDEFNNMSHDELKEYFKDEYLTIIHVSYNMVFYREFFGKILICGKKSCDKCDCRFEENINDFQDITFECYHKHSLITK